MLERASKHIVHQILREKLSGETHELAERKDMSQQSDRTFLSTQEAHEATGLSIRYLQQLLKNKRIDGFKVGSIWFVYKDSLSTFTSQERKRGPKGPHKNRTKAKI